MFAVQAPHRLWTRDEYYKMAAAGLFDPNERVELMAGAIITMAHQDSQHATAVRLAEEALRLAFGYGYQTLIRYLRPDTITPLASPQAFPDSWEPCVG